MDYINLGNTNYLSISNIKVYLMKYINLDNANYPSISNIEVYLIELDLDSDPFLTSLMTLLREHLFLLSTSVSSSVSSH